MLLVHSVVIRVDAVSGLAVLLTALIGWCSFILARGGLVVDGCCLISGVGAVTLSSEDRMAARLMEIFSAEGPGFSPVSSRFLFPVGGGLPLGLVLARWGMLRAGCAPGALGRRCRATGSVMGLLMAKGYEPGDGCVVLAGVSAVAAVGGRTISASLISLTGQSTGGLTLVSLSGILATSLGCGGAWGGFCRGPFPEEPLPLGCVGRVMHIFNCCG
jgi:hypothetical protein